MYVHITFRRQYQTLPMLTTNLQCVHAFLRCVCVCFTYLQCTTMGPALGGLDKLTALMKLRRGAASCGVP